MMDGSYKLDRVETLKKNSDFRRVYSRGVSFVNPALVTYVFKNRAGNCRLENCRLGITTSKKIGNAVKRNRSRRVIRAAYRAVSGEITAKGCSIVFVARGKTASMKSTEIEVVMRQHLRKAGLIEENQ